MSSSGLVVSDTSPLLNLALIDRLDLLRTQFADVTVPRRVWDELAEGEEGLEPLRELRDDSFLRIVEVERSNLFVEVFHELDSGRRQQSAMRSNTTLTSFCLTSGTDDASLGGTTWRLPASLVFFFVERKPMK